MDENTSPGLHYFDIGCGTMHYSIAPCLLNNLQCISGVDTCPGSIFWRTPRPFSSRNTIVMDTAMEVSRGEMLRGGSEESGMRSMEAPDPIKAKHFLVMFIIVLFD